MITEQVLKDIGFKEYRDKNWVYSISIGDPNGTTEAIMLVVFDEPDILRDVVINGSLVNGNTVTPKDFYEKFTQYVFEAGIYDAEYFSHVELNFAFKQIENVMHYLLSGINSNNSRLSTLRRLQSFMYKNGRMTDDLQ